MAALQMFLLPAETAFRPDSSWKRPVGVRSSCHMVPASQPSAPVWRKARHIGVPAKADRFYRHAELSSAGFRQDLRNAGAPEASPNV